MPDSERSIANVLSDIVGDLQHIVRAEVRLAKIELREEVGKAKTGAIFLAIGGVAMTLAVSLLLLSAVFALATIWPAWAAALAVAGGVALIGGLLAATGISRMRDVTLPPQRTVETVRENIQWAKTRTR